VEESTIIMDPGAIAQGQCKSTLEMLLREGGRRLLQEAMELEVQQYVERFQQLKSESGQSLVVRNGYHQERELVTGAGKVPVRQPRVHDRRRDEHFTSAILPPYLRRTPSIDALIPALYLKGVSTSSFPEALQAILGDGVVGLSANNIVRLKQVWEQEFEAWSKRDLHGKRYVYLWADAVYFNVRLEKDRPCVLVVVGATEDGHKELLAIQDGERESHLSWLHLLQDLKARGLEEHALLAVADGALGFWKALAEALPGARTQQCWVHKTANVLDKMSQRVRPDAKRLLHEMYLSPTKTDALATYKRFFTLYQDKYPKACDCLKKDRDVMFTFYDFPAAHWVHLRTTNPIESTFATVRHRSRQTKGCGSRVATLTMVFKLATQAERHWRRLNSHKLITNLVDGDTFVDGELQLKEAA
jgi:putative transposase